MWCDKLTATCFNQKQIYLVWQQQAFVLPVCRKLIIETFIQVSTFLQIILQSYKYQIRLCKFPTITQASNTIMLRNTIYWTRVRPLFTLVTNSLTDLLTDWLTDSLLFSKLDWCNPGLWRCQLKTCWGCYCCWCWCWGSCWQQFVTNLGGDVWS